MRRFLVLILAVAFLIPAFAVEAAYVTVPNFYDITSNKIEKRIEFLGMNQNSYNGVNYTRWNYRVVDGKLNTYLNRYLNKINGKHNIQLVSQDSGNWYFLYTGGQAQYLKKLGGSFHIHVGVSGNNVVVDLVSGMYPQ